MSQKNKERPFLNILFTILIPSFILSKFSDSKALGPIYALIIALLFPIGFSLLELKEKSKIGFFSVLGLLNTLLTGGFALFELEGFWFAVKEASVPMLFALALVFSIRSKKPVIEILLLRPEVFQMEKIMQKVEENNLKNQYKKLLKLTTWVVAASFLLSSFLNFALAIYLLKAQPGTEEFNEQLAKMTTLSFPVIAVPSMVVFFISFWILIRGLKEITGYGFQDIIVEQGK